MLRDKFNTAGFNTWSPVCWADYGPNNPTTVTGNLLNTDRVGYFSTGTAIHPAWHISWEASDVSTLDPRLPTLTGNMRIPRWTPGMTVTPGQYDNFGTGRGPSGPSSGSIGPGVILLLTFGIFALVIIMAGCAACYFFRRERKGRKAKQREDTLRVQTFRANDGNDVMLNERTGANRN